jgi:DNA-binding MarR family transcriptional regulator
MSRPAGTAAAGEARTEDLGVLLVAAVGVFKDQLHAHLARAGYGDLGTSFGFVFRSLADRSLSLTELAARLEITSQGALKIVAAMEDRGYVERHDDDVDRRVKRLHLTTRGRAALREARRFHAMTERQLVSVVGAKQVAGARAVLAALARQGAPESTSWTAIARPF